MLTVWSWEADKELLMDRSAAGPSGGNTKKMASCIQTTFHGEALPHQVWRERPEKVLGSRVTERPQIQRPS